MMNRDDQDIDSDEEFFGEQRELLTLPDTRICDVWAHNFDQQMSTLMRMTQKYNVIAMDTQFPGIYVNKNEMGRVRSQEQAQYSHIRSNVQETKLIQIGLTIADQNGNVPYPICTWQFNFKFDINKQKIVSNSHQLLKKAGVQFQRLSSQGIQFLDFAQYLQSSGFVYNRRVKWVVFHGSSDFAYLLRLVRNVQLPHNIDQFYNEMNKYFPNVYDLKYIIRDIPNLKDVGLAKLSYQIGCNRIGPQHQAGSDSLLTLCCYFKMIQQSQLFTQSNFANSRDVIFGIGQGYLKSSLSGYSQPRDYEFQQQYYYDNNSHHNVHQQYMNHMTYHQQQQQMYQNGHGQHGPLYSYLNQNNMSYMYQNRY